MDFIPTPFCRSSNLRQQERGISLIELLVVIVITGILAVLLLSSVQTIRKSFAQTACVANLQKIGSAVQQFILDNNYYMPGLGSDRSENTRWFARLLPYMGYTPTTTWEGFPIVRSPYSFQEFLCPARTLNPELGGRYGFNSQLQKNISNSAHGLLGVPNVSIQNPAHIPMVSEKFGANLTFALSAPYPLNTNGVSANHRKDNNPKNGPDGNSNYLFVDGHIETRTTWIGREAFNIE